ncbi:glycosyltransferase [Thioclava sp. A2]|uniref:glycosyltransferase n=1 Tax=Thioclava sp. FCG-A2 TaxID=3080562 RepID=UPI002953C29C|nr:glycosyltransferase [Thioclava sp. A2]MDV7269361.1 glycosyltransferase [Thioclava sp. A2]
MSTMKILYYNWVDYLDDEHRGGGVTVYQRNLMHSWDTDPDIQEVFLSAGVSYDLFNRAPRWEQVRHGPTEDRARRYEIVNSGVLAPGHLSFGADTQISHQPTVDTFLDFIDKTGPYDIIHFNNLEGLPVEVLNLKQIWQKTRVIVSLHNYYPFCSQVNLWKREAENCTDFLDGADCSTCLVHALPTRPAVVVANGLAYHLKRAGIRSGTTTFKILLRQLMRAGRFAYRLVGKLRMKRPAQEASAKSVDRLKVGAPFRARREKMIDALNRNADLILCVSDAVKEIAKRYGLRPELLHTSYIGSAHARKFQETHPASSLLNEDGTLTLAYLGYMRRDKGFYFLLDALAKLPPEKAKRVHLLVGARSGDMEAITGLNALRFRLASLTHVDGYQPNELDSLLADVRVGLVPVLWEDNLPQVAIEMHARHIALLTSDRGGAKELGRYADLVHEAGSATSFEACLTRILNGEIDLDAYWAGAMAPVSMQEHTADLLRVYKSTAC